MDGTEQVLALPLMRAECPHVPYSGQAISGAPTDEELIERVQEGDKNSALVLFRRYDKLALSVGLRILQDQGEAEDLAQELFLRLCREANSFDKEKGSARTWIIQVIYRRAFDRRAYLNRRHFYHDADISGHTNVLMGGKSPEEDIIERLTVQQLRAAFGDLSEEQRKTLEMFFFEGLKLAEIAERTGEDVKNVRHHYYRGLERLRQSTHQLLRTRKSDR